MKFITKLLGKIDDFNGFLYMYLALFTIITHSIIIIDAIGGIRILLYFIYHNTSTTQEPYHQQQHHISPPSLGTTCTVSPMALYPFLQPL